MIELFVIGGILYMASDNNKKNITESKTPINNDYFRFDHLFKKYAVANGVDWMMLKAICDNESSLGKAKSVARGLLVPTDVQGSISTDQKSWGLMQFTLPTARDFDSAATPEKLNNAEYSIRLGALFISWLNKRVSSTDPRRIEWIVKSYNQGLGNSQKEMKGTIAGYAGEYWARYQRNYKKAKEA